MITEKCTTLKICFSDTFRLLYDVSPGPNDHQRCLSMNSMEDQGRSPSDSRNLATIRYDFSSWSYLEIIYTIQAIMKYMLNKLWISQFGDAIQFMILRKHCEANLYECVQFMIDCNIKVISDDRKK